jgi:class 3 adenylate cyclase
LGKNGVLEHTPAYKKKAGGRVIKLEDWLRNLGEAGAPDLLIGCTGHLMMSDNEEQNLRRHLQQGVLPRLLEDPKPYKVGIVTGLNCGADLVFVRTACAWLVKAGIPYEIVCLMTLSPEHLSLDWAARRATDLEITLSNHERRLCQIEIEALLTDCETVVDLLPAESPKPSPMSEPFRKRQYRKLTAALSLFTDTLVAVLRQQDTQSTSDIADVMEWRRNPQQIPPELLPPDRRRRRREGTHPVASLVLINPQLSYTETLATQSVAAVDIVHGGSENDYFIARSNDALRNGNYLLCYDLILRAEQRGIRSLELDYIKLLALSNAGSAGLAYRQMQERPVSDKEKTEAWWSLEGRIYRDLAAYGGAGSHRLFLHAANAYLTAYTLSNGYFSAINAASMFLMAGERSQARKLANRVLSIIGASVPKDETDLYYLMVTEAEAALILGETDRLRDCLQAANELLVDNLNARFRTVKQLQLLCAKLDTDTAILLHLTLPYVLYVKRAGNPLMELDPKTLNSLAHETEPPLISVGDFVFCSLADPIDLVAVERFAAQKARLHVTVPTEPRLLVERWRKQFSSHWSLRLENMLAAAQDICVARGFLENEQDWNADYLSTFCLGMSKLTVDRLGAQSRDLKLEWSESGVVCNEGEVTHQHAPNEPELQTSVQPPPGRREAGLIFADFVGFSRLSDVELPKFGNEIMRAIGRLLDKHGHNVLLRRTWGDAIHVVTSDAATAAAIATDIQYFVDLRRTKRDTLARLELRLSAHYAPVFQDYSPIDETTTYFGTALSYAARIEPVAPPGMIFVTEAFAARLAVERPHEYALEYAGELELAKHFGRFRLYSLRTLRD